MSKAFTRETSGEEDEEVPAALPSGTKNYITPAGYARLRAELMSLIDEERRLGTSEDAPTEPQETGATA